MLQFLQKGRSQLDQDHPWHMASSWHLKQIIRQIRLRGIERKIAPFTTIEHYQGQGRVLTILYIKLINKNLRALTLFLQNCPVLRIRKLLWQRFTTSSILDESGFLPSASDLLQACKSSRDQNLLSSAVSNCDHAYWGNNKSSFPITEVLDYFLDTYTWWNTYTHPEYGDIFEIRDRSGHGVRWDLSDLTLLECVEPNTDGVLFRSSSD